MLEAARIGRNIAHFTFTRASDTLYVEDYRDNGFHPYEKYLLFQANEIGVLCGGASRYLAEIYKALGFIACHYNYGIKTDKTAITHMVTLVNCPVEIPH